MKWLNIIGLILQFLAFWFAAPELLGPQALKRFEVTDRINITLQNDETIQAATSAFGDYIKAEVLGNEITFAENVTGTELVFDDVNCIIKVARI